MKIRKDKPNRNNIGNAGEYYMAYILSSKNCVTTLTLGRAEKYDLIVVTPRNKTVRLQVKTLFDEGVQFRMDKKHEHVEGADLFYAFVRLNKLKKEPDYWIFPSKVVAKIVRDTHASWLRIPGRNGKRHKDGDMRTFRVKWNNLYQANWNRVCEQHYKNTERIL